MSGAEQVRLLDWRFLLPVPERGQFEHLMVPGAGEGLCHLIARTDLARKVSPEVPGEGSADAVALLRGSRALPEEVIPRLQPGGVFYWEIERRWSSFWETRPSKIRKRLIKLGLATFSCYFVRSRFGWPHLYLPLDDAAALAWYLDTMTRRHSVNRWLAVHGARVAVAAAGRRVADILPRFVVVGTVGPPPRQESTARAGIARPGFVNEEDGLPVVMMRRDDSRRVIAFCFGDKAKRPTRVVKFWRVPGRNRHTELEQETLQGIRPRLDERMRQTVPEPLGTLRIGLSLAGVESYGPGATLSRFAGRRAGPTRRDLGRLQLVFRWLTAFHSQAQVSRGPLAIGEWAEEPLAEFAASFGSTRQFDQLRAETIQRANDLKDFAVPIVWSHPDLTGANIHIEDDRIFVVDWSGAAPRLPLFDLTYFLMLWPPAERALPPRLRRLESLFLMEGRGDAVTERARAEIRRYMKCLDIDPRFFPVLLSLAWIVRSVESFYREAAAARGKPDANAHPGESYVEYVELLAEHTHVLFSRSGEPWWMS